MQWLTDFVIKQNLCPFAKREVLANNVRAIVCDAKDEAALLAALYTEIQHLVDNKELSTTLLVHPNVLNTFEDYNQFLALTESLLEQQGWIGGFQIASFHPNYLFADTEIDDAENYTNRSPYPMLHILREKQVERAIERYPDIEQVPLNNIQLMNQLGTAKLQAQLNEFLK